MASVVRLTCLNHPDRPAQALCRGCGAGVCVECSGTWEGIHLCTRCLGERRGAGRRQRRLGPWLAWSLVMLVVVPVLLIVTVRWTAVWAGGLLPKSPAGQAVER